MPIERLGVAAHDKWPTLGWFAVEWIERFLCRGPGDIMGDPVVLDDDETQFLLDAYRLFPKRSRTPGRRVALNATYSRAKGSAKSELAAMIVLFEAVGPARFAGWSGVDPVPRPVVSPFIRCLATEETQTGNTFDGCHVMASHVRDRFGSDFPGLDVGLTRIYTPGNGEIRPSTASSSAKDGGKETFAVADETHLYVLPEHKRMRRTVERNLSKRKEAEPWMLSTTTMFASGEGSLAESDWDRSQAVKDGLARDDGLYLNWRGASPVEDWDDDSQLLAGLREAYGDKTAWVPIERILTAELRNPEASRRDSERYWLNIRSAGSDAAFDVDVWDALGTSESIPDGATIVLGFDGARYEDSTALIAIDIATGLLAPVGIWERPSGDEHWEVSEADVDAAVADAFDRFDVWRMYCDPPWWESSVDRWAGLYGKDRVAKFYTQSDKTMAYAVRRFVNVLQAGELHHTNDPALRRHIVNCRRRRTRVKDDRGEPMWTVQKERRGSPLKIDAAVASIIAAQGWGDAVAAGVLAKKRKRKFVAAGF